MGSAGSGRTPPLTVGGAEVVQHTSHSCTPPVMVGVAEWYPSSQRRNGQRRSREVEDHPGQACAEVQALGDRVLCDGGQRRRRSEVVAANER